MSLHVAHPLVLVLLIVVAMLAAGLQRRAAASDAGPSRLGVLVPAGALGLLVLALSAPELRTGAIRPTTFVVDHSASVDAAERGVEAHWLGTASHDSCARPCHSVAFASAASTAGSPDAVGAPTGTNLAAAVSSALGQTPRGGRVVVLSDGGQTRGDALAAAAPALARGIAVDWVPLTDARRRDAAITAIHTPAAVRVGDEVPLSLTVHSTVAGTAVLRVQRDGGASAAQRIHLQAGDNPLLLSYTATQPGWSSFTASVRLPGDAVAANDVRSAVVDVTPEPRVLVVTSDAVSPTPPLLARERLAVSTVAPAGMPTAAGAYRDDAAVVLDDVPATLLSAAQVSALSDAVRAGGMGLVALGGPHSFSEGRYWGSPLQRILPVISHKPGKLQRRNLAVELVLDHSGSMIDLAGGAPKIDEARASARQAAAFIANHRDQIGIIDFDTAAHTLVPLTSLAPGASERGVDARIATLQAEGGTNIYAGLQAGFEQLLRSHAPQRHLILVTDGISTGSDYGPLLALMRREKISAATVALGADADRSLLAQIAHGTGGHTYATDNANDLPRILTRETQRSAKPARVTGRLAVSVTADSPIVRSLAGATLPALSGNVVVTLKHGAQADLSASGQGNQTNPALAEWQIGTGRVVAWTPGLGAPWARSWLAETSLWNDAVRWSDRGISAAQTQPTATSNGMLAIDLSSRGRAALATSGISGTLTGADGASHPVSFTALGPALYQADVADLPEGVYRYSLTADTGSFSAAGEVALAYPTEYSPVPVYTSPVGQLVAQTGGRVLSPPDPGTLAGGVHSLQPLLALLALVAFLAGVAVRLGLRLRPRIPAG